MENAFGVLFSLSRGTSRHGAWVIACLQGAWPKLVGDRLADACAPVSFDGATLVVEAKDRQWEDAVRSIQAELLDRIRAATAGEIGKIRVVRRPAGTAD